MLAKIRKRRGIIASVEVSRPTEDGVLHQVRIEYTDSEGVPEDTVIWEREVGRELLEPHALPRVDEQAPMRADEFDALCRATRWSALTPFLSPSDPNEPAEEPIASPFFGAVEVDGFQLVPLVRALEMPRVSMLLADSVGLGKSVEAGLILTELLLRRRIRRVLILTPASLRQQWKQEMRDKFSVSFDVIDRPETHALQRRLGLDANPWRTYPRIISSYHYLRQDDIKEQFLSTCRSTGDTDDVQARLPWDLLIVDEAHNLMPSNFGEDSDLSKLLRAISPYFEHKLFLTATPHNGHTRCFTGLLEQLDPVRFTQKAELTEAEKNRIQGVVVRRLKREINDLDREAGRVPHFAERELREIALTLGPKEAGLSRAVAAFRRAVKSLIRSSKKSERLAGAFTIEVLVKRLLSCPYTFAESWTRFRQGLKEEEAVDSGEVNSAQKAASEDLDDDRELEGRARHAARTAGAWLKPFVEQLSDEVAVIDACLENLGLQFDGETVSNPNQDSRFDHLVQLIDENLREGRAWNTAERLIVFTEYKTTLDYLKRRLHQQYADDGTAIRVLYGGMTDPERDQVKEAFNDPHDPVRVLVATDAASEGLNLQETARLLIHYEIPWSPIRLEQRNGRLDRYGQARDVIVRHFSSEDDADLRFMSRIVQKVNEIREDLGSFAEVFGAAIQRRLIDGEETEGLLKDVATTVRTQSGSAEVPRIPPTDTGERELARFHQLARLVDLSPETLRDTLKVALGIGFGEQALEGPDATGRMKLARIPPRWQSLVDDTARVLTKTGGLGPVRSLVFDPRFFIRDTGGRPVFRPKKDTLLLHLGHPLFRHALAEFAQARFPGGQDRFDASRWIVRRGPVPAGADALVLLTVEELAVNELRESFHVWVRTLRIPVKNGRLVDPAPFVPPADDCNSAIRPSDADLGAARDLWLEVEQDLRDLVREHARFLTERIRERLDQTRSASIARETSRYEDRRNEVREAMRKNTIAKLEKEAAAIRKRRDTMSLFAEENREEEDRLRNIEDELRLRTEHYEDLLKRLEVDQERVLTKMLPLRYRLSGAAQAFPVSVEIRLPEVRS